MLNHFIQSAVQAGMSQNTIELLLLLPGVTALIAFARHIIGIKGFGIFLPAALSVALIETGPLIGISFFLMIFGITMSVRMLLRKFKIKLQYLPRMSLLMFFVSIGILFVLLFMSAVVHVTNSVKSIFPVLILILLSEDVTRVQLGKSAKIALSLTMETLGLAFAAYLFMIIRPFRTLIIEYPEIYLILVLFVNILVGKYFGLRISEYRRFHILKK